MSIDEAINIIQRCELGKQGRHAFKVRKELAAQEERDRKLAEGGNDGEDRDLAAIKCQRLIRGFLARRQTKKEREQELIFLGMAPPPPKAPEDDPVIVAEKTKAKRKLLQEKHMKAFVAAHDEVEQLVYHEEGPDMREDMMDVIRQYWADWQSVKGEFPPYPDVEDGGSTAFEELPQPEPEEEEQKKEEPKKGKGDDEEEPEPEPEPDKFIVDLHDASQDFLNMWLPRDEKDNFQQQHVEELLRDELRDGVRERIRLEVDEQLRMVGKLKWWDRNIPQISVRRFISSLMTWHK